MFSVALFCSAVFCFFVLLKMVSLLVKLFLKPNIFVFFLAKLGRGSVPSCSPVCIISSKIGHFPFSTPGHTFYFDYRSRLHSLVQSKLFQQCVAKNLFVPCLQLLTFEPKIFNSSLTSVQELLQKFTFPTTQWIYSVFFSTVLFLPQSQAEADAYC